MFYVLLLLSILSLGYYIFAIFSARRFFAPTLKVNPPFYPPVSILKPVCGMENRAYENFASFCQQTYPVYQIIFGVREANDPIIEIINKIMVDFPHIDIQLIICEDNLGNNPKINNLVAMQNKAKHLFLLISDSDIRVGPTYLREMVQFMSDEKVGAVTCVYRSVVAGYLSIVEAICNATESVPGVLCAWQLEGIKCTLGWSILIRQAALNVIGGMNVLADYIAEDNMLGKLITDAGYRIVLSPYVVENALQDDTPLNIIRRKIRWSRGTLAYNPWVYLSTVFTYGTVSSLLFLFASHASQLGLIVFSTLWITRLIMSWIIGAKYLNDQSTKKFFWLSPLQDCMSFILWMYVWLTRNSAVYWRGSHFKVEKGGKLVQYPKILKSN